MELNTIDITNASFKANPFPFYARLRTEAPVYPVTLKRYGRTWLVTRYDDVLEVLKDERFVAGPNETMPYHLAHGSMGEGPQDRRPP
jgi:cytochrome P450